MPYVIAQMFPLSIVTLKPMLLHSCPLLFASGIHFLKLSETPLHSANLNPTLTKKIKETTAPSCTMLEVDNIKLITLVCDYRVALLNYDLHRRNSNPSPYVLAVPLKPYRIILPSAQYINQCVIVTSTIYPVHLP